MSEVRSKRVEELLREEIASLILRGEIKDPRVHGLLSITRVEAAKDFSYAKVFVSSLSGGGDLDAAVEGLNSAHGFIQSVIGRKIRLRLTPKLHFVADTGVAEGFAINEKIRGLMG
jgi:ribosome-binding factor A